MNNIIKGSIAGATGVALLVGGFGTYALWSDSRDLQVNGVQSGDLTIGTSVGVYDDAKTPAVNDWLAADKMVPGDTVTYTQVFDVTGSGKNLKGTIELAPLTGTNGFDTLTREVDVTKGGAGAGTITKVDADSFTFSAPFGSATLTAKVTYTFPSTTSGTADQLRSFSTPAAAFTIAQTTTP